MIGEITKTSSGGKHRIRCGAKKRKGAFVSESALHFDGDKPNSVPEFLRRMIIYLIPLPRDARYACARRDATIPEDQRTGCPTSVPSCTAWGFSCPANCFASGELLPRLFTLTCTSLPKNRRCLFCDTFRHRALASATPACFPRHAAVWCSDFPLRISSERSSAITLTLQLPEVDAMTMEKESTDFTDSHRLS